MYYQPTPINWNGFHFLIMSAPDDSSMKRCIAVSINFIIIHLNFYLSQDMKSNNVKVLVRCCDSTYDEKPLIDCGIQIHEFNFEDGKLPTEQDIHKWLEIVDEFWAEKGE